MVPKNANRITKNAKRKVQKDKKCVFSFSFLALRFFMITIIHGDDIASSRTYYKSLQKKETIIFDGEKVTVDEIQQAVQTTNLFGDEKSISLENFFSKRRASKEMDSITMFLKTVEKETQILFWETKILTKKPLGTFANPTIKTFSFPQSLFAFLDNLKPDNTKSLLKLYHQTREGTEAELIFFMIIKHIRMLLALTDISSDEIDELKRLAPWQKNKLVSQSRLFSINELKQLHAKLFDIEIKSKTGGLSLPLSQSIDFLLTTI